MRMINSRINNQFWLTPRLLRRIPGAADWRNCGVLRWFSFSIPDCSRVNVWLWKVGRFPWAPQVIYSRSSSLSHVKHSRLEIIWQILVYLYRQALHSFIATIPNVFNRVLRGACNASTILLMAVANFIFLKSTIIVKFFSKHETYTTMPSRIMPP